MQPSDTKPSDALSSAALPSNTQFLNKQHSDAQPFTENIYESKGNSLYTQLLHEKQPSDTQPSHAQLSDTSQTYIPRSNAEPPNNHLVTITLPHLLKPTVTDREFDLLTPAEVSSLYVDVVHFVKPCAPPTPTTLEITAPFSSVPLLNDPHTNQHLSDSPPAHTLSSSSAGSAQPLLCDLGSNQKPSGPSIKQEIDNKQSRKDESKTEQTNNIKEEGATAQEDKFKDQSTQTDTEETRASVVISI
jgi:hypothetical protein